MPNIVQSYLPPIPRRVNRVLHAIAGLIMVTWLGVCAVMQPDPSSTGTHRQLGLPGCIISRVSGIERCPSCGLTTSFSHLMRGDVKRAQSVHSAGLIVFITWCLIMCYCFIVAASGINLLAYEIPALAILCTTAFVFWLAAI